MKNEWVITITDQTANAGEDEPSAIAKSPVKGNESAKKTVKGLLAYNTYVKPFVAPAVNHLVQSVSLRTGANELQQRIQFGYDVTKSVINIGTSVATGFAVGHGLGAIVGALAGIGSEMMNYAYQQITFDMQKDLASVAVNGLRTRAGYSPSYNGSRGSRQ